MERVIDGTYTLNQTRSAVLFQEAGGYELMSLRMGSKNGMLTEGEDASQPVNHATFRVTEPVGRIPGEVHFLPIPEGHAPAALVADQMANGRDIMFIAPVFVEGQEVRIAAFRQLTT